VLVIIGMTVAPVPIAGLLCAVPPDKLTMPSVIFSFPPAVSTGFTFIPLMVITVLAIEVSMDPRGSVIVIAVSGIERSSPKSRWASHGCHQNKRT
jgi:hypothetical protein